MTEDCRHTQTSQSEESYFYKETARLVSELRRMAGALKAADARGTEASSASLPGLARAS